MQYNQYGMFQQPQMFGMQPGMQGMAMAGFGQPQPVRMHPQHPPAARHGHQWGVPSSPLVAPATPPARGNNADLMAGSPTQRPAEKAVRIEYDPERRTWVKYGTVLKLDMRPFADGSMRHAYRMKDLTKGESDKEYVAKLSKDPREARDVYYNDVEMQMEAKQYADKFNKRFGKPGLVDFLVAYVAELVERPGKPLIGVEQRIVGNYVKYNNNWDWSEERRNTPQAFSHFTYEESGHKLLICDLQGVGNHWTDPQIHSADGRGYGKGNMGQRGIQAFLTNHRCNFMCKALKLPAVGRPPKSMADGTRLRPDEDMQKELGEEEPGSELTRTQRKAEKLKNGLKLAGALANRPDVHNNRLVVQVCKVTGLGGADGVCDALVTVMCGEQTCETRVVYNSAAPEWNQRFQMALDSSVAELVAVVFDHTGEEPVVAGKVVVPFQDLKDDAGFDEREWPLMDLDGNRPTGANLLLKVLRYMNMPRMAAGGDGQEARGLPGVSEKDALLKSMQGVKVMIKQAQNLRLPEFSPKLYAFVHIDNCEARTRSVDADTSVAWNQKMAFPSCGTKSIINVEIKTESSPSISVASKTIPVDTLPWDAQGQVPSVWVGLEDAYSSGGRGQGGLAGWYANNGNALAPGGPGGPQSDAPSVHLQAWILFKPNAELAQRPKAAAAGNGTVSC